MLLTIQNNIEIFKYTKNSKVNSGFREDSGHNKKYSLNTRKSFQITRSPKKDVQKLESPSSVFLKRSVSALKSPKNDSKLSYYKESIEDLNKSSSIEILNLNDDSEFENQLSYQSLVQSRRHSKSSIITTSSIKLPTPKNENEISKNNQKIRLIQSAPLKHKTFGKNNARPASVVASTNAKLKEKKKEENRLSLNEFCQIPKYPRLIAYLSVDAQFAMLKAYEDTLYQELNFLYPQIDIIPKTGTPRFKGNNQNNPNNFTNRYIQNVEQFSLSEEEKIKISFFIECAMKILDLIYAYKRKKMNKYKLNFFDSDCEEENCNDNLPLDMYIQWIELWNKEFL